LTRAWFRQAGIVILAGLLLLAAACGDDDDNNGNGATNGGGDGHPVTVMRSDGVELVVEEPPGRIVSLSPAATEIIYAIGAEEALAAVDNFSDYPQAAADFPTKLDAYEPNAEAIAGVEPDLVVVAFDAAGLVEALDRLDIPVLYLNPDDATTIEHVLEYIVIFGDVTGHRHEAADLVESLELRIAAVEEAVGDAGDGEGPSVYHELDDTFYTVSEDTFIGNLYVRLGARNIAGDGGGTFYPQLTQEAIIDANPDVIILGNEAFGVTPEIVSARPGWSAISAVQDDRIYGVDPDIISRPGPRIVDAFEELARHLYPERFE
jgi:iron complex transport system substrate-binding protein